ncbi:MAG: hypothetical protein NWR72_13370 [Bacteroidia bacterium]|nr:hypothetical protein [Bacteroidia bacterium]
MTTKGILLFSLCLFFSALCYAQKNEPHYFVSSSISRLQYQYNFFSANLSIHAGKLLIPRVFLGVGFDSYASLAQNKDPNSPLFESWIFSVETMWLGVFSRAYLKKYDPKESPFNPFIEVGLGPIYWTGPIRGISAGSPYREHFFEPEWRIASGFSLFLGKDFSLDLHGSYFPYSVKIGESGRESIRPHSLRINVGASIWLEKHE